MRVITNSKYIAHTDPIFKTLNLLILPDLYRLQLYKLYYKIKKQTVPAYFRHILTEVVNPYNTRNTFFKYPIARHEYTRKTCLYQVINYVNYPPSNPLMKLRTDMSDTHSITGFALYHKNRTLESYSLHCRIIDCYVCRVCQLLFFYVCSTQYYKYKMIKCPYHVYHLYTYCCIVVHMFQLYYTPRKLSWRFIQSINHWPLNKYISTTV